MGLVRMRIQFKSRLGGKFMQNLYRTAIVLAAMVMVVTLAVVPGFAQTSNGTIAGTISDKTGGAVVKATVSATSQDLGKTLGTAVTDSSGGYRIDALFPGKYTVRSEEHTSELQSLAYLVCRLLLE